MFVCPFFLSINTYQIPIIVQAPCSGRRFAGGARSGLAAQLLSVQPPWPDCAGSFHLYLLIHPLHLSTLLCPEADLLPCGTWLFGQWGQQRQDIAPQAPSLPGSPQASRLWRSRRWDPLLFINMGPTLTITHNLAVVPLLGICLPGFLCSLLKLVFLITTLSRGAAECARKIHSVTHSPFNKQYHCIGRGFFVKYKSNNSSSKLNFIQSNANIT